MDKNWSRLPNLLEPTFFFQTPSNHGFIFMEGQFLVIHYICDEGIYIHFAWKGIDSIFALRHFESFFLRLYFRRRCAGNNISLKDIGKVTNMLEEMLWIAINLVFYKTIIYPLCIEDILLVNISLTAVLMSRKWWIMILYHPKGSAKAFLKATLYNLFILYAVGEQQLRFLKNVSKSALFGVSKIFIPWR